MMKDPTWFVGQSSGPTHNSTGSGHMLNCTMMHLSWPEAPARAMTSLLESLSLPDPPCLSWPCQAPCSPPLLLACLVRLSSIPVCKDEGTQVCAFLPSCLYKMLLPTQAL